MGDWLILGEQTGFRRKEWAQDRTYLYKHKDFQRNVDGSSAVFILTDMEFRAKKNKRINNNYLVDINKAKSVNLKWRYQKNLDNGQVIPYVKDSNYKKHCFVEASKRIHKRAKRLSIKKDNPIAVVLK